MSQPTIAYDPGTPIGQVRLLVADLSAADPIMDDIAYEGYLNLNGFDVRLAAADALDAIAVSEVLVSKVIKTQDLSTNGPAVAASLQARAATLRQQSEDAGFFDLSTFTDYQWPAELTEWPCGPIC